MKIIALALKNPKLFAKKIFGGIPKFFKLHILKDDFTINMKRWFLDKGDETLRLNYPSLEQDSIVFDVGGYLGDFACKIHMKYNCKVYIFEPHPKFYEKCETRFKDNNNIIVLKYGLSDTNGTFELSDNDDGSSFLAQSNKGTIVCETKNIIDVLHDLKIKNIDLMKINIEGGEYPLLQYIADNNMLNIVNFYQIQFHNFIENASIKRNTIINNLKKTHQRNWCYEFVWENWQRK